MVITSENLNGLQLTGSLCSECGYIHPVPLDGICPVANQGKISTKKNTTHTCNDKLKMIINDITNMITEKSSSIDFENAYTEEKFYMIIKDSLIKSLQEILNGYKV